MRWIHRVPILITAALALALPGPASAVSLAPPGKAGANQYFETVPTASGDAAPPQGGSGFSGPGSRGLSHLGHGRAGAAGLARLGKSGHAAAALAAATAPSPAAGAGRSAGRGGPAGLSPAQIRSISPAPSQSTAAALANLLSGSDLGGLGWALPLFLAVALLGAIGLGAFGFIGRRGGPPDATA